MARFYRRLFDEEDGTIRFEVAKEIVLRLLQGEGQEVDGGYTLIAPDPAKPANKRPIPTPVVQALRAYEGFQIGNYVAVQFNAAEAPADSSIRNDNCVCDAVGISVDRREVRTIITER